VFAIEAVPLKRLGVATVALYVTVTGPFEARRFVNVMPVAMVPVAVAVPRFWIWECGTYVRLAPPAAKVFWFVNESVSVTEPGLSFVGVTVMRY
jgi:hypothetical protein